MHMISRWYSKQYDATTYFIFFVGLPFFNFYRSFIFALPQKKSLYSSLELTWCAIELLWPLSQCTSYFSSNSWYVVVVRNSWFNMRSNYLSSNHQKVLVELLQYFIVFHNFLSLFQVRQLNFEDQTGNPLNFENISLHSCACLMYSGLFSIKVG